MRILELRPGGESPSTLELHPHLTLVQGLDEEGRRHLAEAIKAMAGGEAKVAGLVEAHGVIFDLTSASLRLLGLNADLDLVVRAGDLPGHDQDAETDARDLARAQADRESRLARLERAKGVLESVTQARASLVAAIEQSRQENASRARDVVEATTALANARQERHRARSIREMVERELADARDAHQALVDSRVSTSEALERAGERHHQATDACAAAAGRVRDAHAEVALHDAGIQGAQAAAEQAEKSGAAVKAEEPAPRHKVAARLFRSRKHEGGGVAVTTRQSKDAQTAPAASPARLGGPSDPPGDPGSLAEPPATDAGNGNTERLHSLEARRAEAAQKLDGLGPAAPTQDVRAARDRLAGEGSAPTEPQAEVARGLATRWRETAKELEALGSDRTDAPATTIGAEPVDGSSGDPEDGGGDPPEPVASPSPLAIEDRLFQADATVEVPVEPLPVASARLKLAKARKNREQAGTNDVSSISAEQIRQLEDAHHAVLDAQERTEARFGGAKARRRLAEARGEERRILDQLGFSTYADYMMSASSRFQNGPDMAVLDTAERSLITARQAFVKAWRDEYGEEPPSVPCPPRSGPPAAGAVKRVGPAADPEPEPAGTAAAPDDSPERRQRRQELWNEQAEIRAEAEGLLGRPAGKDVASDLDAHAGTIGPPTGTPGDELARLLADQGIALGGEEVDRDTLIEYADVWLEEQRLVAWRRAKLEAEIDQIDRDVVRLHDAIAAHRDQLAAADGEEQDRRQDKAKSLTVEPGARQDLEAPKASAERSRLTDELASRQAELEGCSAEEREAAEALDGAETMAGITRDDELAAAAERLAEAERARENALADEQAASAAVSEIEQRVADGPDPAAHDLAEREVRLEAVDQDRRRAEEEIVVAESEVELADHTVQALVDAESARRQERTRSQLDQGSLLEDIDWYLLSRLASQRSVSVVGSLPLVLDDAFAELPDSEVNWLLGRLERMTSAVQVIVLTDRPESAQWAGELGPDRAAVVHA